MTKFGSDDSCMKLYHTFSKNLVWRKTMDAMATKRINLKKFFLRPYFFQRTWFGVERKQKYIELEFCFNLSSKYREKELTFCKYYNSRSCNIVYLNHVVCDVFFCTCISNCTLIFVTSVTFVFILQRIQIMCKSIYCNRPGLSNSPRNTRNRKSSYVND